MDENNFEEKWRTAMAGAEAQPSELVWSSVEAALISAENQNMKRQVILYRRLAAALLIFALSLGAGGFYFGQIDHENLLANDVVDQVDKSKHEIINARPESDGKQPGDHQHEVDMMIEKPDKKNGSMVSGKMSSSPQFVTNDSVKTVLPEFQNLTLSDNPDTRDTTNQPRIYTRINPATVVAESPIKVKKEKEESMVIPGINDESNQPEVITKHPKTDGENAWASLSFAAGNYNPGAATSNSTAAYLLANNPSYQTTSQSSATRPGVGSAYSVGFILGKRLADRWVIQGGINYVNQSNGYVSDLVSTSQSNQPQAFDLNNLSASKASSVTVTNPYHINSTLEFISIPLQAGYLLVNRKIGFQLNAGAAADFFVRNSLEDPSGQTSSYSQGAGTDSPYRSLNWAGLVSSEVSYKLGRQYRISLVPGVRYFFNSTLKSGSNANAYITDVGFRFRYILR